MQYSGGLGSGSGDTLDQTGAFDVQTATMYFPNGIKLVNGTADFIKVTVNDDLVDANNKWLRCYVKGYEETP